MLNLTGKLLHLAGLRLHLLRGTLPVCYLALQLFAIGLERIQILKYFVDDGFDAAGILVHTFAIFPR